MNNDESYLKDITFSTPFDDLDHIFPLTRDQYLTEMIPTQLLYSSPGKDCRFVTGPTEDLRQHENVAFEAQSGANGPPLSPGGNKEKLSSSTGSKKRDHGTFFTGESSTSMLPAELPKKRKTYKELIEDRSVVKSAKVLRDRIGKRTESVMAMQRQLHLTYEQIKTTWPPRDEHQKIVQGLEAQLETIGKYIDEIVDGAKQGALTEPNAKKKLIKADSKLNEFNEALQKARKGLNQISQELEKTRKLDTIFTNSMNHSPEYLREELSSVLPIGIKKLDCIGVNQNQDHGSLPTLDDLLSKLYDKGNNIVDFPDFAGLQEALKKAGWGKTPGYLEHIAVEIETAIGKRIEIPHIRVLLSAAIKEMKDLRIEELEGDMFNRFKKWEATLNHAKEKGYDVKFAYTKLEKFVRAYRSYHEY